MRGMGGGVSVGGSVCVCHRLMDVCVCVCVVEGLKLMLVLPWHILAY